MLDKYNRLGLMHMRSKEQVGADGHGIKRIGRGCLMLYRSKKNINIINKMLFTKCYQFTERFKTKNIFTFQNMR